MSDCVCFPAFREGYEYVGWIGRYFGDCVWTFKDRLSFGFGSVSLCCYILAMLPQLIHNFKRKNVEGLSLGLLLIWTFGDLFNLIGTILTHQLPLQKATASYFVFSDVISLGQYFWYLKIRRYLNQILGPEVKRSDEELSDEETDPLLPSRDQASNHGGSSSPLNKHVISVTLLVGMIGMTHASGFSTEAPLCDAQPILSPWMYTLGSLLAWISGILYFTSRIPQILENIQQKSVEGLSPFLFFLTISGNLLYGLSILIRLPAIDDKFYLSTLPYLFGSMGVLIFDFVILGQFVAFS